jgi:hypothetical protein
MLQIEIEKNTKMFSDEAIGHRNSHININSINHRLAWPKTTSNHKYLQTKNSHVYVC